MTENFPLFLFILGLVYLHQLVRVNLPDIIVMFKLVCDVYFTVSKINFRIKDLNLKELEAFNLQRAVTLIGLRFFRF